MSNVPDTLLYMIAGYLMMIIASLGYIVWLWVRIEKKIQQIRGLRSENFDGETQSNDFSQ